MYICIYMYTYLYKPQLALHVRDMHIRNLNVRHNSTCMPLADAAPSDIVTHNAIAQLQEEYHTISTRVATSKMKR